MGAAVFAAGIVSAQPAADPSSAATQPASSPAPARLVTVEGRIIGQEEGSLVVDIGARAGAVVGGWGELWRPVQMRHPVTKRSVEDRYRIGTLRVTDALLVMSFARVEGELRQEPRPGDIVVMRVAAPEPLPSPQPVTLAPSGTSAPQDADARAVGTPVEAEPSPAANFGGGTRDTSTMSPPRPPPGPSPPPFQAPGYEEPRVQRFAPPASAFSGAPLDIGIEVTGSPRGVLLHSRHGGEVGYRSTAMRTAGADFWVATVEADRMRAPGLDYFIEVVRGDGVAVPAVAGSDAPLRVTVRDAPKPAPAIRHRSTASAYTDYADYNRLHGNDRAWQTEGFLGMRFEEVGLRALRTGFGVYRGVGGSVTDLDVSGLSPRNVGLTYGYLEGEAGISPTVSIVGRGALGLGDAGVSGGGQLHLRIGSDLDTNLMVGGEVLGGIGLRGIGQMAFFPQSRFPSLVRIEVTNQPGGEVGSNSALLGESTNRSDIAGRVILQGGFRILPPLVVFARVSYQGRTIVHAGPGIGGGATFEW